MISSTTVQPVSGTMITVEDHHGATQRKNEHDAQGAEVSKQEPTIVSKKHVLFNRRPNTKTTTTTNPIEEQQKSATSSSSSSAEQQTSQQGSNALGPYTVEETVDGVTSTFRIHSTRRVVDPDDPGILSSETMLAYDKMFEEVFRMWDAHDLVQGTFGRPIGSTAPRIRDKEGGSSTEREGQTGQELKKDDASLESTKADKGGETKVNSTVGAHEPA
ncbi:hypothetical protein BJ165DRAFT_1494558 [Panaeolus papilionaceus]|nr:hypothetical protein BJ165DRAFT_1494558 [Panaeolus papilionaceus]